MLKTLDPDPYFENESLFPSRRQTEYGSRSIRILIHADPDRKQVPLIQILHIFPPKAAP